MKLALKIENREMVRKECGLSSVYRGKLSFKPNAKNTTTVTANETQADGNFPMRTTTLRGVKTGDNRREGPTKRLSDTEFQSQREKKYLVGQQWKGKEKKELRMLVVKENGEEMEIIEEEYYDADVKSIEIENVENLNIELTVP